MYFKSNRYNGRRKLSFTNLSPVMRKERKGKVLQQVENFEIYKGCLLRTKENFSLVMLIKGKFSKQHDNFEIYKDCLL